MVSVNRGKVPRAVRAYGRMVCLGETKEGFPGKMMLQLISQGCKEVMEQHVQMHHGRREYGAFSKPIILQSA